MGPFQHVLVALASKEDAVASSDSLVPYLEKVEQVTAVHVIEKAEGRSIKRR